MITHTCIEAIGIEQGFHVTLVSDVMAAYSPEAQANAIAIAVDGPTCAHAIYSTSELRERLPAR